MLLIIPVLFSCSAFDSKKEGKELKGFYSYMADAGLFYSCENGEKYPVAFEGDNLLLENTYLKVRTNPGEKILVTLVGHFISRKKIEGDGMETALIVTKFKNIYPNVDCNRNLGTANLANTFWAIREMNGKTIENIEVEKDIHFLIEKDHKVKGFAGCNNFFGSITFDNDTLKFDKIGATFKLCDSTMKIETEFFQTLDHAIKYEIYGEYLYLYGKNGLLAKFESVYFN